MTPAAARGHLAGAALHRPALGHMRHDLNQKYTGLTHNFLVDPAV
jgi:hypothetical protein